MVEALDSGVVETRNSDPMVAVNGTERSSHVGGGQGGSGGGRPLVGKGSSRIRCYGDRGPDRMVATNANVPQWARM